MRHVFVDSSPHELGYQHNHFVSRSWPLNYEKSERCSKHGCQNMSKRYGFRVSQITFRSIKVTREKRRGHIIIERVTEYLIWSLLPFTIISVCVCVRARVCVCVDPTVLLFFILTQGLQVTHTTLYNPRRAMPSKAEHQTIINTKKTYYQKEDRKTINECVTEGWLVWLIFHS